MIAPGRQTFPTRLSDASQAGKNPVIVASTDRIAASGPSGPRNCHAVICAPTCRNRSDPRRAVAEPSERSARTVHHPGQTASGSIPNQGKVVTNPPTRYPNPNFGPVTICGVSPFPSAPPRGPRQLLRDRGGRSRGRAPTTFAAPVETTIPQTLAPGGPLSEQRRPGDNPRPLLPADTRPARRLGLTAHPWESARQNCAPTPELVEVRRHLRPSRVTVTNFGDSRGADGSPRRRTDRAGISRADPAGQPINRLTTSQRRSPQVFIRLIADPTAVTVCWNLESGHRDREMTDWEPNWVNPTDAAAFAFASNRTAGYCDRFCSRSTNCDTARHARPIRASRRSHAQTRHRFVTHRGGPFGHLPGLLRAEDRD